MRPTLTRTLYASFFALTLLVLLATLGLARWSFERGFFEYVKALDRYRLEAIAEDLVALYSNNGQSWNALDDAAFDRIVQRLMPGPPLPPPMGPDSAPGSIPNAVPNAVPAAESGAEPSAALGVGPSTGTNATPDPPPAVSAASPPGMRPPSGRAGWGGPTTALFDISGLQIAGPPLSFDDADHVIVPVFFEGERIAELQATVRRLIDSPAETVFAEQQARASVLIGVAALALAAIASWLLARRLLAPVEASITSVARLSRGDYALQEDGEGSASHATMTRRGDELGRLAGDIERLRQTLASARSSRRHLLADISHELRTPLTILGGEIAAMKDGLRPLDAVQLASIDQEVERLKTLVEDLYELSVSDAGGLRYKFVPMDIRECLERCVESFRHSAQDAGIKIELTGVQTAVLEGDARRLTQLLTNLLSNSIAYTDAPGRISISLTASEHEVHVVFEDSPPEVRTDSYENLFESLYRGDRSRRLRPDGAGLGLAICRNIVDAHGGRIAASRSELGGLRVDIELPKKVRVEP